MSSLPLLSRSSLPILSTMCSDRKCRASCILPATRRMPLHVIGCTCSDVCSGFEVGYERVDLQPEPDSRTANSHGAMAQLQTVCLCYLRFAITVRMRGLLNCALMCDVWAASCTMLFVLHCCMPCSGRVMSATLPGCACTCYRTGRHMQNCCCRMVSRPRPVGTLLP